jgi:transcriptional regulator with XRE-family HTH domain
VKGGNYMQEIKQFRTSLNLSAKAFAETINVSKSLQEKIEIGIRKPSREYLEKLKNKYPQFDVNIFFNC